jgi:cell wall-associated NlpC family hydrolase
MFCLALYGCASDPQALPRKSMTPDFTMLRQHPGALIAADLVGAPYRYGGSSPRGFDCSGLVYFSYRQAGIRVPRSTLSQYRNAYRVPRDQLQPGDLVFFKLNRHKVSHVGIYAGNDLFIHAPSKEKQVSFTSMNDPFWHERYVGAGRYY